MTQPQTEAPAAAVADWHVIFEIERRAYPVGEALSIGRDAGGDIVIQEPNVSRAHARVTVTDGVCEVENLGATGTKVNGVRIIVPQPLREGDRIQVGMAVLTLRRPPLPLGVSVVDRVQERPIDLVASRRPTVRSPLLVNGTQPKRSKPSWVVFALVAGAAALLYFLGAGG